ncbi:putative peroxisomal proliferator-activated receptor a-interacting complex 285 kda protein [Neofusicoccum parvum UCRNP2]|uniref:Putative peroxisomal proliferator-activated receptor a-interacting complex 285 kDa protein n=1 Tax=Botryosphaeria parva (strain UCR-NP2) TaxID=1287680 RepID=R1GLH9_BOTPV|nr:putative peroxisomal proliferator-activated receptor a-interacting complex 285 kda protein [Neofusicoccum parvum UCRNP2]
MREREQYELIVRDGWLLGSLKASMKFRPFPGVPGQCLVCIWGCNAASIPTKLPSLESRILISSVFDEEGTASSFSGVVCEDLLNTKAHVLACVRGDSSLTIDEDAVYPGFILQVDEEVPASRLLLGLQKCSELKNADGVDVANALAIREPTVKNPGCLSTEFRSTPEMRQRYRGVTQRADIQLSKREKGTVEGVAHSSTGLYAICGSPGTGKTHISCVVTEGLAQCGKSTAYVTPTSDARDEAMKMFLGITNLAQDQIVRFVGDYKHGPRGFGQDHQPEDRDLVNDVWELYERREQSDEDDTLGKYDFHVQLDKYIAAILQDDTHVLFNDAKVYDSEKHELWLARLLGSDRAVVKALRDKLDRLRTHKFAESYLQSRCKVIFLADSQAAAENVVRYVKVQCLVIDEAGMFTAPRMAVPLGVFKDGLELLVLAGDPKQKPLPISSSKTNEFAPLLETSVLQRLHEKGSSAVART